MVLSDLEEAPLGLSRLWRGSFLEILNEDNSPTITQRFF